jgi:threonine dehydrogenase-like Zn-dependent dehydrogenase
MRAARLHDRLCGRAAWVTFDGQQLFFSQKGLLGGPAPVRRFLPHLMDLVLDRKINPGKVFDLELPLSDVAEGYRAMDERRAIKVLLRVLSNNPGRKNAKT